MFDDELLVVENGDFKKVDLSKFPVENAFNIELEKTKTFGVHISFVGNEYGAGFPWWDNADVQIRKYTEKNIPYGDIESPHIDLEQGWQICIFKEKDYIYILTGLEPGEDRYYSWYRVNFDTYRNAWLQTIEKCKKECVAFESIDEAMENKDRVKELVLNYTGNVGFPEEIFQFPNLEKLKFMGDKIGEIPIEIGKLINLKTLAFSGADLKKLPETLNKLTNLKELYLNHNKFKEFPYIILSIKSLETLDICDSKYPLSIPPNINKLINLHSLWLNRSNINTIPDKIGDLSKLILLSISDNPIDYLPESLTNLSSLETLYCTHANLNKLPQNLSELKSIKVFQVNNNNLTKDEKDRAKGILKDAFVD
ncbi:MAG: leucine-rich repeat domain-containing protein [Deltaproteobacteria bacterium]|nr:leucine-rich repeat domain-containing protein [Deltaproteobacteria bacterium]